MSSKKSKDTTPAANKAQREFWKVTQVDEAETPAPVERVAARKTSAYKRYFDEFQKIRDKRRNEPPPDEEIDEEIDWDYVPPTTTKPYDWGYTFSSPDDLQGKKPTVHAPLTYFKQQVDLLAAQSEQQNDDGIRESMQGAVSWFRHLNGEDREKALAYYKLALPSPEGYAD
jgi:hypothetical protein